MASVTFDPAAFKVCYPEFASVADARLSFFFTQACLYLSNESTSPVQNIARRSLLLNMITAHIGFINGALSADGQARPVGRVSQAGEGSVNASFEDLTPGSAAWFQQSQYGAAYWQATSSLRGFRYIPCPTVY